MQSSGWRGWGGSGQLERTAWQNGCDFPSSRLAGLWTYRCWDGTASILAEGEEASGKSTLLFCTKCVAGPRARGNNRLLPVSSGNVNLISSQSPCACHFLQYQSTIHKYFSALSWVTQIHAQTFSYFYLQPHKQCSEDRELLKKYGSEWQPDFQVNFWRKLLWSGIFQSLISYLIIGGLLLRQVNWSSSFSNLCCGRIKCSWSFWYSMQRILVHSPEAHNKPRFVLKTPSLLSHPL